MPHYVLDETHMISSSFIVSYEDALNVLLYQEKHTKLLF